MQNVPKLAKAHLSLPQKDTLSMDVYGVAQILDHLNTIIFICDEIFFSMPTQLTMLNTSYSTSIILN